ncbi:MAG: pyridoxal phosphate-dependent aminotransferase [Lachnospiraceae bacterium]|nr:pyridoxal phosphate-dependent aminotransferase [Lachnospiraceae bacterium]
MINQEFKAMLSNKNVIRNMAEFAAARGKEIGYENVFDFSLGNPSTVVPQEVTDYMIRLLQEKDSLALHGYSPTTGNVLYKEKIAESLNERFGMEYTGNHIFPTTGAAGALAHAVRAVTKPGDEILLFAPFFPEYTPYLTKAGLTMQVVPADTETFQINFDAFEEMLSEKTAAVLINTPNNPSGVVYSEETLTRLAKILYDCSDRYGHNIFLISDEPYREILYQGVQAPFVSRFYDHTLVCYSFAKSLSMPGERIGYVAVNPRCEDAEYIVPMCGQISRGIGHNCPPSFFQIAVAQFPSLTSDIRVYEKNMNLIYDTLMDLNMTCVKPDGTFYIFPKAPEEDSIAFCEKAKQYDLILVPGDSFGAPGFFRMAYCIDTEKVERAMPRFRQFIQEGYGTINPA